MGMNIWTTCPGNLFNSIFTIPLKYVSWPFDDTMTQCFFHIEKWDIVFSKSPGLNSKALVMTC